MTPPPPADVVFNIVWVGTAVRYLGPFVASQLAHGEARYRFVTNACPPAEVARLRAFADRYPDRVVEVFEASNREMIRHGEALDRVLAARDDGPLFAFIDPDILATGPFLSDFTAVIDRGAAAVTSGRGVWCDDDVVPPDHYGVNGEYFWSRDGFCFGSPHLALYRRDVVEATMRRWGIGFGSAGPEIPETTTAALVEAGHRYWLFDTAKLVNICLQIDGGVLRHTEHPELVHVGGMSHYLSPPETAETDPDRRSAPRWTDWDSDRFEVARFTAEVLRALVDGTPVPTVPAGLDTAMAAKLERVRSLLVDLVSRHGAP